MYFFVHGKGTGEEMKKNKTLKVIASSTMISSLVLSAIATPIMAKEGWNEINGSWTYESNGSKQTGWSKIGNSWFSFDKNGTMQTGWTASGEFWYWLSPGSGVMQDNGWITDGSNQPFFIEPNGVMATDTVKDGYEIKADGTRVLLSDSNSVVLGAEGLPEGTVVEGNLYVTADAAKDLEFKGITVKGKLVIEGGKNVKLTDSNIQGLKMNQADAVVTLSGKTEVKNAELTKQGTLEGDKNYKGEVENVKIASLVKGEATIGVVTDTVTSNSWAPVNVEANVKNLIVSNETELNIGKGIVVDKVVADAPVVIKGDGKITELEANSDGVKADVPVNKVTGDNKGDVTNTEGGVVEKPSTGGGSSGGNGGGSVTPPTDNTVINVGNIDDLKLALEDETIKTINLTADITGITETLNIKHTVTIDGKNNTNNYTLSFTAALNDEENGKRNGLLITAANSAIKNLNVVMGNDPTDDDWHGLYGIQVYNAKGVTLNNVSSTKGEGGILINGSEVTMSGTIDVSGNEVGGIEVSKGEVSNDAKPLDKSILNITDATIINEDETKATPAMWIIAGQETTITGAEKLSIVDVPAIEGVTVAKTYYYANGIDVATEAELTDALADKNIKKINLTSDLGSTEQGIVNTFNVSHEVEIEGNNNTLTFIKNVTNPQESVGGTNGLLIKNTTESITISNLNIVMANNADDGKWNSIYGIQVYNAKGVTLNNVSSTNGEGGILINGSEVVMTGTIKVSNNEVGGIEVSKGDVLERISMLTIVDGTVLEADETAERPTIWIIGVDDNAQGKVNGGTLTKYVTTDGKTYYYSYEANVPGYGLQADILLTDLVPSTDVEDLNEGVQDSNETSPKTDEMPAGETEVIEK